MIILLTACTTPTPALAGVEVNIRVDGKVIQTSVPAGSSVQDALTQASVATQPLDKVTPSLTSAITAALTIDVVRVTEQFDVEETTLPFVQQTVKNESLPEGQTLLIQAGVNGTLQTTYRQVYENGVEISRSPVKSEVIREAQPEIIMVGVQTPFSPIQITGRLAYLSAGSAWVMEENTGNRRPVVTSGDLDGRVFSLSPDGEWLLYTRKSAKSVSDEINTLWVINVKQDGAQAISLKASNIIHFADWVPGQANTVVYTTVEPRSTAPGWQANNDLQLVSFSSSKNGITQQKELIEANSGGIYGWWGMTYAWSADGTKLAFARPDSIGLVNLDEGKFDTLVELLPFQARGDWAWTTGLAWSPENDILYYSLHQQKSGLASAETSPVFDVAAWVVESNLQIDLVPQSGMFAYPSPSPVSADGRYLIAYLQAIFPEQSDTSRYRLMLMDRDGSNRRTIFPSEGLAGMDPQQVVWSPVDAEGQSWLAVLYQDNLWLINPGTDQAVQVTGDQLVSRVDWQ